MSNITNHGKTHLWTYIRDYINGDISEINCRLYLGVCFSDIHSGNLT